MNNREKSRRRAEACARVDLHCHSTASHMARLGVQRALALPECATPPTEVYRLAKRRGMDFVTITDHDTIDGVLEIADAPDVFISEELTARFAGEPQAVHVLCYGITPDDHAWLQAHAGDVVACAEYLHGEEIACALAHPFFHVAAPLTARHRRVLSQLFPIWETRNGSRPRELNAPAAIYIDTHGGAGLGGSDDHAGIDIGRTYTETPPAHGPQALLEHIRSGRARPGGEEGSPAKLAHSALVLAARALAGERSALPAGAAPDPRAVLEIAQRAIHDGQARGATGVGRLTPEDARQLLGAWIAEMGLEPDLPALLALFQRDEPAHAQLRRRARRRHEQRLAQATTGLLGVEAADGLGQATGALFSACLPAVPYLPAAAFMAQEKAKLSRRPEDPVRVAVVTDGVGSVHGVAHTLAQLRDRGIAGHEIEAIGTDACVDHRLPAAAEVELPHYPGLTIGVPSLLALGDALTTRPYDLVHVCAPGPAGIAAAALAKVMGVPLVGSYHTELQAYARTRTGSADLERAMALLVSALYRRCDAVLVPSVSAAQSVAELGVAIERVLPWGRGVDTERFSPLKRLDGLLPGAFNLLYVGRLSAEKGIGLLAEAFLAARDRDPRLHLVLAGRGPEEGELRRRLGSGATFLGWLEGEELARVYASADLFVFAGTTDTFGQVILEAQASGLPVLAVEAGGPAELIEDGRSGCLVPPDPQALADSLRRIARRPVLRERLSTGGLRAVQGRTWERSLTQLAAGYARALAGGRSAPGAGDAVLPAFQ